MEKQVDAPWTESVIDKSYNSTYLNTLSDGPNDPPIATFLKKVADNSKANVLSPPSLSFLDYNSSVWLYLTTELQAADLSSDNQADADVDADADASNVLQAAITERDCWTILYQTIMAQSTNNVLSTNKEHKAFLSSSSNVNLMNLDISDLMSHSIEQLCFTNKSFVIAQTICTALEATFHKDSLISARLNPIAHHYPSIVSDPVSEDAPNSFPVEFTNKVWDLLLHGKFSSEIYSLCVQEDQYAALANLTGGLYDSVLTKIHHSDPKQTDSFATSSYFSFLPSLPVSGSLSQYFEWKNACQKLCKLSSLSPKTKAIFGSLSGTLQPVLDVCSSWQQILWAYLRCYVVNIIDQHLLDEIQVIHFKAVGEQKQQPIESLTSSSMIDILKADPTALIFTPKNYVSSVSSVSSDSLNKNNIVQSLNNFNKTIDVDFIDSLSISQISSPYAEFLTILSLVQDRAVSPGTRLHIQYLFLNMNALLSTTPITAQGVLAKRLFEATASLLTAGEMAKHETTCMFVSMISFFMGHRGLPSLSLFVSHGFNVLSDAIFLTKIAANGIDGYDHLKAVAETDINQPLLIQSVHSVLHSYIKALDFLLHLVAVSKSLLPKDKIQLVLKSEHIPQVPQLVQQFLKSLNPQSEAFITSSPPMKDYLHIFYSLKLQLCFLSQVWSTLDDIYSEKCENEAVKRNILVIIDNLVSSYSYQPSKSSNSDSYSENSSIDNLSKPMLLGIQSESSSTDTVSIFTTAATSISLKLKFVLQSFALYQVCLPIDAFQTLQNSSSDLSQVSSLARLALLFAINRIVQTAKPFILSGSLGNLQAIVGFSFTPFQLPGSTDVQTKDPKKCSFGSLCNTLFKQSMESMSTEVEKTRTLHNTLDLLVLEEELHTMKETLNKENLSLANDASSSSTQQYLSFNGKKLSLNEKLKLALNDLALIESEGIVCRQMNQLQAFCLYLKWCKNVFEIRAQSPDYAVTALQLDSTLDDTIVNQPQPTSNQAPVKRARDPTSTHLTPEQRKLCSDAYNTWKKEYYTTVSSMCEIGARFVSGNRSLTDKFTFDLSHIPHILPLKDKLEKSWTTTVKVCEKVISETCKIVFEDMDQDIAISSAIDSHKRQHLDDSASITPIEDHTSTSIAFSLIKKAKESIHST